MSQRQSDKCNACSLPKGTRVHNLDTGNSGTVTRSRSSYRVFVLWDGDEKATKHSPDTKEQCNVIEEIREETDISKLLSEGMRVYNTVTERKGTVTRREVESVSVQYDNDYSATILSKPFWRNLREIEDEAAMRARIDKELRELEGEEPMTTTQLAFTNNNVTSQRGSQLVQHVEVIQKRQELMDSEMLLLAQALLAMALYTEKRTSRVENCSFGASLLNEGAHGSLRISFFLKEPGANEQPPSGITWKGIVDLDSLNSLTKDSHPITNLLFLLFGRRFGTKKKGRESIRAHTRTPKQDTMGSYTVTPEWSIADKIFPMGLVRLLPTATALVQAELDIMKQSALDDIIFIEAFEEQVYNENTK